MNKDRKNILNGIVKEVKHYCKKNNNKPFGLIYPNLNLMECDYLYSKGINITKGYYMSSSFILDDVKFYRECLYLSLESEV